MKHIKKLNKLACGLFALCIGAMSISAYADPNGIKQLTVVNQSSTEYGVGWCTDQTSCSAPFSQKPVLNNCDKSGNIFAGGQCTSEPAGGAYRYVNVTGVGPGAPLYYQCGPVTALDDYTFTISSKGVASPPTLVGNSSETVPCVAGS